MATPISRRTILAAGAGAAASLSLPGAAAHAGGHPTTSVGFTLDAEVLDGGEQVTSITLETARLGTIDPASLTNDTFSVHAKATSPIPIAPGDVIFSEYDLDRPVTAARLDHRGDIVLDLSYADGQLGGGTLGYIASKGRNVRLDLVYTITQNAPITVRHGRSITISSFVQGRLANPEVDAFSTTSPAPELPRPRRTGQAPPHHLAARRRRGRLAARQLLRQRDHAARQPRCAGLRHATGTTDLLRRLRRGPAEHLPPVRGCPGVTDPVRGVHTDLIPHAALTACRLRAEPADLDRRLGAPRTGWPDPAAPIEKPSLLGCADIGQVSQNGRRSPLVVEFCRASRTSASVDCCWSRA
jgi:hypothetical protein